MVVTAPVPLSCQVPPTIGTMPVEQDADAGAPLLPIVTVLEANRALLMSLAGTQRTMTVIWVPAGAVPTVYQASNSMSGVEVRIGPPEKLLKVTRALREYHPGSQATVPAATPPELAVKTPYFTAEPEK